LTKENWIMAMPQPQPLPKEKLPPPGAGDHLDQKTFHATAKCAKRACW
jgi:hypothetical protein